MSDWDADDFEPEVAALAPPPAPEIEEPVVSAASKPKPVKKADINMESLGRELTAAEREALQKQRDLELTRDMFGFDTESDELKYEDIISKEDFEEWGNKVGTYLSKRHKATHYGDLINKLILAVSEKLEPVEIRKIAEHLKKLADSKKEDKPKAGTATAAGKKKKAQLKGATTKNTNNVYDDYGGDKYDDHDDYDDFM